MKICKNFPSNQSIWYFQNVNKYSFPMILYSTIDIPAYDSENELAGFALYIHWFCLISYSKLDCVYYCFLN